MTGEILVHVGYHKTASSLLQNEIFGEQAYGFLSTPNVRTRIVEAFVSPPPLFGANPAAVSDILQSLDNNAPGFTRVVSHERLSGYPASGGIDQEIIARRIKESLPGSRIMMVIREQKDMILSMYYQYIIDGGSLSLTDYLTGVDRHLARSPQFLFEYYDYVRAFRMYQQHFGVENVLCLPYEMLKSDPERFLLCVAKFCSLNVFPDSASERISRKKVNSRRTHLELGLRRLGNKIFRTQLSDYGCRLVSYPELSAAFERISKFFPAFLDGDRVLSARATHVVSAHVMDRFSKGNAELARMIKIPLERFGYEVRAASEDNSSSVIR